MTVSELFNFIKAIRPGNAFTDEQLMVWLNEIEGKVQTDIMLLDPAVDENHTGLVHYTVADNMDTELIVPYPWSKLYRYFLLMCIDIGNAEYQRYANSYELFNEAYEEYAAWYAQHIAPANGDAITHGYYLTAYQFAVRGGFHGTEREFETALGNLESQHGYCNLYDFPGEELQDKLEYALNHYGVDPDATDPVARCVIRIPDITITRTLQFNNAMMAIITGGTLNIQTETAFETLSGGGNAARAPSFDSVTFIGNGNKLFGSIKRVCNTFTNCNFINCVLYNDPNQYLQSTHLYNCRIQSGSSQVTFITCMRLIDFKMDGCIIEEGRGGIIKCYDPPHDSDPAYDISHRPADNNLTCSSVVIQNTMCEARYPEIPFQFTNVRPLIIQNCYFESNRNGSISLQASWKYKAITNQQGVVIRYDKVWLTSFAYIHHNFFSYGATAREAAFIQHNHDDTGASCLLSVRDNIFQNGNLLNKGTGTSTNRHGLIDNNNTTLTSTKLMPEGQSYWGVNQNGGITPLSSYDVNTHIWTLTYRIGITNRGLIPFTVYCKGAPYQQGSDSRGVFGATVTTIASDDGTASYVVTPTINIGPDGTSMGDVSMTVTANSTGAGATPTLTFTVTGFSDNMTAKIIVPQTTPCNAWITQA